MSGKRYTEEFKVAADQTRLLIAGHPCSRIVAERLGVSIHSIYAWTKAIRRARSRTQGPRCAV
ncbi:transposase [Duganella sp. HH105]|uniref:transposase n=1 Tax=Duganella sp. HH105 TaxID=1781067 RepID=UPI0035A59DB4